MNLYFLRHADAVWDAATDFGRPLTPKGISQAKKIALFCQENDLIPSHIWHSPYLRAAQTAEILQARFPSTLLSKMDWMGCGMSPQTLCNQLNAAGKSLKHSSLFLVGHEPDFSQSVETLLGIQGGSVNIRKASLTSVFLPFPVAPATACLDFSLPVKFVSVFESVPL